MTEPPSQFRTTEIGTIPLSDGNLELVTVKSPALASRVDLTLYLPKQIVGIQEVPVILLLHGVYCSHWAWALSGKAHLSLQRLINKDEIPPMILAMPSDGLWGDGSGYFKHSGKDFESWIVKEVPQAVSEVTGNPLDTPHFIAGLSMGGWGALRLGAAHANRFQAFSGHSSITKVEEFSLFTEEPVDAFQRAIPDSPTVRNVILQNQETLRPFRFDCGVDDPLIEGNRQLCSELKAAGIRFSYEEFPGGHEWPYWEEHIEKTYQFFASLT